MNRFFRNLLGRSETPQPAAAASVTLPAVPLDASTLVATINGSSCREVFSQSDIRILQRGENFLGYGKSVPCAECRNTFFTSDGKVFHQAQINIAGQHDVVSVTRELQTELYAGIEFTSGSARRLGESLADLIKQTAIMASASAQLAEALSRYNPDQAIKPRFGLSLGSDPDVRWKVTSRPAQFPEKGEVLAIVPEWRIKAEDGSTCMVPLAVTVSPERKSFGNCAAYYCKSPSDKYSVMGPEVAENGIYDYGQDLVSGSTGSYGPVALKDLLGFRPLVRAIAIQVQIAQQFARNEVEEKAFWDNSGAALLRLAETYRKGESP